MREVHRLSGYHIEGAVRDAPIHTKSFFVPLPPPRLSIFCLEKTTAGISISIHFRTIATNSKNFQTHPVCNLLSTSEINPSENIFNNNVMQNEISKIVKSGRFSQFLKIGLEENFILKSGRLQPPYIRQGIEYTSIYSPAIWHRRIAVIAQKGPSTSRPDLVGSRILWSVWGYLGGGRDKEGNRGEPSNFRGISLASNLCKLFNSIL